MTTDTTVEDQGPEAGTAPSGSRGPDPQRVEEFAEGLLGLLTAGSTALMLSVGHRTGLLDALAGLPPSTSAQVAAEAGLHERYVREWLRALTTAGIVEHDAGGDTYRLPAEHAAVLTSAAGPDNLAAVMQFLPLLAQVEDQVVRCFAEGGGVPYADFARFDEVMAESSALTNDAILVDHVLPLAPGLTERLQAGMRVADVGCGQGHLVNLLARAFPRSEVVGYDFLPDALEAARAEARGWGLTNARFEERDVADLAGTGTFGLVTAFDSVHDQAHPATVLRQVADHLDADGTFLMADVHAHSDVEANLEIPWSPLLYALSTMHCMTVSLAQGGDGLGTVWGTELALQMLAEAGFTDVRVERLPQDFLNSYYVARR